MSKVNREYKDSVFTLLFKNKENLISLYNAIANKNYPLDTDVEFNTLDQVLFRNQKNDLSFLIDNKFMILIEHQSTINENMPTRLLSYVSRLYEGIITGSDIYKEKMIKIPTPNFIVLYNGTKDFPKEKIYRLSDAFMEKTGYPQLELIVRVININYGQNDEFLQKCKPLNDYSIFISKTREYFSKGMEPDEVIKLAVDYCIKNDKMKEFLLNHMPEVRNMSFGEFNMNDALKAREEEGFDEGRRQGQAEGERIGIEKGREEGERIGIKKGQAKGELIGIEKGRRQIIANMKANGFTDEQIARVCGGNN